MLCSKCNFTTFDYADTCKKCGYDLKAYREPKRITASKPASKSDPKHEKRIESVPNDAGLSEPLQTASAQDSNNAQSSEISQIHPYKPFVPGHTLAKWCTSPEIVDTPKG